MEIDGRVTHERVCLDKSCYRTTYSTKTTSGEKKQAGPPSWHGTFFREEFYKERIPVVAAPIPPDSCQLLHATLVAILEANHQARSAFARKTGTKGGEFDYANINTLWPRIEALGPDETKEAIKEATVNMVLQGTRGEGANAYVSGYSIGPHMRHVLAGHLGIELALDWRLTEGYLKKKTIAEVLGIGRKGGLQHATSIFDDPKAKAYLLGTLKRKSPEACRKSELIELILKSGADLSGRVPDEILKEKDDQS
jgi:hypothetical protein